VEALRRRAPGQPQARWQADAPDGIGGAGGQAQHKQGLAAEQDLPYLLRDLTIDRPNQVWAADITYSPMAKGFLYLACALRGWRTMRLMRGVQEHFGLGRLAISMRQRLEAAIISNEKIAMSRRLDLTEALARTQIGRGIIRHLKRPSNRQPILRPRS
jgi:transposase InsO family protein